MHIVKHFADDGLQKTRAFGCVERMEHCTGLSGVR